MTPKSHSPTSPPVRARGTVSMMISGCRKLSNWAASTRNTMIRARPKVRKTALPDSLSSRASPSKAIAASGGSSVAISFSMYFTASPSE